ncbi:MAG: S16 family serine protease [Candidatus Bilamarchaeaceae archaeon]
MRPILLAMMLIVFAAYAADCSGSIEMGLPAVNEGGDDGPAGDIVVVRMHLVDGEGNAYLAVSPSSDETLQQSILVANLVARREAGNTKGDCDILVEFLGEEGGFVKGPSGGAAFSLMAYSLLTGKALRKDAAITGAVAPDGSIIPVGGVYEKAVSSKKAGKRYLITPVQTMDERLMLRELSGIGIYEAENMRQAINFFVGGILPEKKSLNLTPEPLPELEGYSGEDVPAFAEITVEMINDERAAASKVGDAQVREYFWKKIEQQEELLSKGYYYSAANDAFLNYILADSLSHIGNPDVDGKMREVGECIAAAKPIEPTYENYEWVMGGDARMKRAENQLAKFEGYEKGTKEEDYYAIYELDYALAWCQAASRMYAQAEKAGGSPIDELVLKGIADEYLGISENYTGIEESENYQNGLELYEEGRYAGAIHEIVYALSFERKNYAKENGELSAAAAEEINQGKRKSVWGRIFQAHTEYLLAANDTEGAYATAVFSAGMEGVGSELLAKKAELPQMPQMEKGNEANESGEPCAKESPAKCAAECPPPPLCSVGMALLAFAIFPLFIKKIA